MNSASGRSTKARAMPTRCLMPPDSSFGYADSKPSRPIMSMASRASLVRSARGTPRAFRPSSTLSCTVSHGISAKVWNTSAMPGFGPVSALPRYLTVPLVGLTSPASARRNVDLPAPERPRMATISPSCRLKEMLSNTVSSVPLSAVKRWPTCWASMMVFCGLTARSERMVSIATVILFSLSL